MYKVWPSSLLWLFWKGWPETGLSARKAGPAEVFVLDSFNDPEFHGHYEACHNVMKAQFHIFEQFQELNTI